LGMGKWNQAGGGQQRKKWFHKYRLAVSRVSRREKDCIFC
jgi:hypothetical protein